MKNYLRSRFGKIGGVGIRIQLDETVLVRGRLIRDPSNAYDSLPQSVWLFGGIEEGNPENFFLRIIPERRSETLLNILKEEVAEGSILVTDGHPSYPRAAMLFGSEHIVVNHSTGFKNSEGDHTNNIENLWGHLKSLLRTRHGILRTEMEGFVSGFTFRKRVIRENTPRNIECAYKELLGLLFN